MPENLTIRPKDETSVVFEKHFSLKCPNCGIPSNMSAVSFPRWEYLLRFKPKNLGIVYRCDSCNEPVFLKFTGVQFANLGTGDPYVYFGTNYQEVQKAQESYDLGRLPKEVAGDFKEALICYSNQCLNAFGAMCRRTIQSACNTLGAEGKDKVLKQIEDLREMAQVDDETFDILKQIVIAGHDGAHPHLPPLAPDRADVLLELMKDVLYQLFIRKQKLNEAAAKRAVAIASAKKG